jgi:hypothetical protein
MMNGQAFLAADSQIKRLICESAAKKTRRPACSPYPLIIESVGLTVSILALSPGVVMLLPFASVGVPDGFPQAAIKAMNAASIIVAFFIMDGFMGIIQL